MSHPDQKNLKLYVDYIDRDNATRNDNYVKYSLYQDYMDNPEKSTSLFTAYEDEVKDKKKIKELFKTAQENGNIMWQDVVSFNNEWLEEHGIYDSTTKILDEKKIKRSCTFGHE